MFNKSNMTSLGNVQSGLGVKTEKDEENKMNETNNLTDKTMIYYAGLINTEDTATLFRTIHRVTRGTAFLNRQNVKMDEYAKNDLNTNFMRTNIFIDPKTKKPIHKDLIFVFFMNPSGNSPIISRINNLFANQNVFTTEIDPSNPADLEKKKIELEQEINDAKKV